MTDDRKEIYNKYTEFPDINYNITKYMLENNDLIWRLLKYQDNNAWKLDTAHPNLTTAQKGALINNGDPDPNHEKFRIFFDVGQDDAWVDQVCILRIVTSDLIPSNHVYGKVIVSFGIFSHYQINTMSNYKTRVNVITQQLLELFDGQDVGGIGALHFDARASNRCRMSIGGQIPFTGNILIMSNWVE